MRAMRGTISDAIAEIGLSNDARSTLLRNMDGEIEGIRLQAAKDARNKTEDGTDFLRELVRFIEISMGKSAVARVFADDGATERERLLAHVSTLNALVEEVHDGKWDADITTEAVRRRIAERGFGFTPQSTPDK